MKRIKKKGPKPVVHEQWVEITRKNGKTISNRFPSNAEFERLRLAKDPPPALIYRRLNFVHGVPAEYLWTKPDFNTRYRGGGFLHRMKAEDWPAILQAENEAERQAEGSAESHIVPSEHPLARPAAFGPCHCRDCRIEREAA